MPTTTVKWVSGKTFVGTDSRNHSVVLSSDDPAVGVSPSQMLLVALSVLLLVWPLPLLLGILSRTDAARSMVSTASRSP